MTPDTLGVADTLVITFDEAININDLKVETTEGEVASSFKGDNQLLVFGTIPRFQKKHFAIDQPVTITLSNLRDKQDNLNSSLDPISLEFYPWVDGDHADANVKFDKLMDSPGADQWINGAELERSTTTEGALFGLNAADLIDYKLVFVEPDDSLEAVLTCPKSANMTLAILGPYDTTLTDSALLEKIDPLPNPGNNFHQYQGSSDDMGRVETGLVQLPTSKYAPLMGDRGPWLMVIAISSTDNFNTDVGFYRLTTRIRKLF